MFKVTLKTKVLNKMEDVITVIIFSDYKMSIFKFCSPHDKHRIVGEIAHSYAHLPKLHFLYIQN